MQKIILFGLLFFSVINTALSADPLELAITPIRTSINASLSGGTTGSVTLYNNSNTTHSFKLSIEDCTAGAINGTPLCNPSRYVGVHPNSLASWVTFNTTGTFSIPPRGNRTISYTINPPANAIPGGHYGAIFFNNQSNNTSTSISMNRRIGSLLLVTIPGDIIVNPEFGDIIITGAGGGMNYINESIFDLFSPSQTGGIIEKGKKLLMVFTDPEIRSDIIDFINPFWDTPELPDTNSGTKFNIKADLPIKNNGTIHISPEGKVTLHDTDGTQLLGIGKELILNENGAIIGEKVVDHLIINEENGNVLPGTTRNYTVNWEGFAQEYFTNTGKLAIRFEAPGSYYSRITKENQGYMYPWEKLSIVHTIKTINAKVDLSYIDPVTNERVPKNSELPIKIEFDEIKKTWNTGLFLIVGLYLLWIFLKRRRKNKSKKQGHIKNEPFYNEEIDALENAYNALTKRGEKFKQLSSENLKLLQEMLSQSESKKHKKEKHIESEKNTTTKKAVIKKTAVTQKEVPAKKTVVKKVTATPKTPARKIVEKEVPVTKTPTRKTATTKPAIKKTAVTQKEVPTKKTAVKKVTATPKTPARKIVEKEVPVTKTKEGHKKHKKK